MNLMYIILWLFLIILIFVLIHYLFKKFMLKSTIIYILSTFKYGNFILVDKKSNIILKVINNPNKVIPIVKIYNEHNFFNSIYNKGELGLGESYVRNEWSCDNLIEFMNSLCLNEYNTNIPKFSLSAISSFSKFYDKSNIKHHYDVGNDFYQTFLKDDLNAYSCGFWFNSNDNLNTAQYNKIHTIINKLNATQGSHILDIGCGWGKIANYVSKITNSKVTGITISDEQEKFAKNTYDNNKVIIKNMDYRDINEQYNYIYSIGMFEHVRYENYDKFFSVIKKSLKPGGRFVLHTIITFDDAAKIPKANRNYVTTHIFPGGQIPKSDWILNKARKNGLNVIHFEGFGGQHYAKTLKIWRENMWKEKNYILSKYPKELLLKYDYYLTNCEAGFNTGILGIGHFIIVSDQILSLNNSYGAI